MIDFNTAALLWSGQAITLAAVQVGIWLGERHARHHLSFGLGFAAYGIGILCIALRGMLPEFVSIQFANALALSAFAFWGLGVRQFDHKPPSVLPLLPVLVWTAANISPAVRDTFMHRVLAFEAASILGFVSLAILIVTGENASRSDRAQLAIVLAILAANAAAMGIDALGSRPQGFSELRFAGAYCVITVIAFLAIILLYCKISADRQADAMANHARIDPMTAALNRPGFEEGIERTRQDNSKQLLAIALFDLDHFRAINDTHGHVTGDALLCGFTVICQRLVPEGGHFGRVGGDEFAMAMPVSSIDEAVTRAQAVRLDLTGLAIHAPTGAVSVTTSIGIAAAPAPLADFKRLMSLADRALGRAKGQGRDRIFVWNDEATAQTEERARAIDDQTDRQVAVLQRVVAVAQRPEE